MLCPIIFNSNTIELIVHTSCYWVLDLLCVFILAPRGPWIWTINLFKNKNQSVILLSWSFFPFRTMLTFIAYFNFKFLLQLKRISYLIIKLPNFEANLYDQIKMTKIRVRTWPEIASLHWLGHLPSLASLLYKKKHQARRLGGPWM